MKKFIEDKRIEEMAQYWIDNAEQDILKEYAKYKMIQWYEDQSENQINEFYSNHLEQVKEDLK